MKAAEKLDASPHSNIVSTRGPATAKGKNVRISPDLYAIAEKHANVAQRSVQKQIEYWSQLGRLFEMSTSNQESFKLLNNESQIAEVVFASTTVPSSDSIMSAIEQSRRDDTLTAQVAESDVAYELAEDNINIRQIDANGTVKTGSLVDGMFVESPLNP